MKKFSILLSILFVMVLFMAASCDDPPTAAQKTATAQSEAAEAAYTDVPVPKITYFAERRTAARWAERWDKPGQVSFVYLLNFGNFIGYYVVDGKPASTQSYLVPEESFVKMWQGKIYSWEKTAAPDLDGTWGKNNGGIRFFTAEGAAVEWGGDGATYLFSDTMLPLNVPRLNVSKR